MDSELHGDTVKAIMLVRDPVTQMLRRPVDDDLPRIRDGDSYDAVVVARGISRAHAAFERFTFDRTGEAMEPDARVVEYWQTLDAESIAKIPVADPYDEEAVAAEFAERAQLRDAAHALLGEALVNDYMRATCRSVAVDRDAAYPAAIEVCRILTGKDGDR
jgi:hypothetical protein